MPRELLTLAEASRRLGLDPRGRRLRRLLLDAEKRVGRPIGVRVRGRRRTLWRVTEAALRASLPGLFTELGATDLERRFAGALKGIDERIDARAESVCRRIVAPVRQELLGEIDAAKEELFRCDERIGEMVLALAERVSALANPEVPSVDSAEASGSAGNVLDPVSDGDANGQKTSPP